MKRLGPGFFINTGAGTKIIGTFESNHEESRMGQAKLMGDTL